METAEQVPGRREWLALAVLLLGNFAAQIDFFVMNVALPTVRSDLGASLAQVQLIAIAYGGGFAVTVVTAGRLGDLFGRRRLFIVGLTVFGLASLACGVAWSGWALVAARAVQGVGAATLAPQAVGSLHAMFPGRGRVRAFSIFGAAMGLAWVSGILLGGLIVGADIAGLGWRAIFLINAPLAAIALIGAVTVVTESRRPGAPTLDLGGMLSVAAISGVLVVALTEGRGEGWPLWAYACLALAVAGLPLLLWIERRVAARGQTPIMSPQLIGDRNFRLGLLVIVVFFLGPPGFFLLSTLYLQSVRGFSPLAASLVLLPFGVVFVLTSYAVKWIKIRLGDWVIAAGVPVMFAGLAVLVAVVAAQGNRLTLWDTAPGMALIGLGQALVTTPLYEMLLRNVNRDQASTASAVFTTVQLITQAVSVALLVIIFTTVVQARLDALLPSRGDQLRAAVVAAGGSNTDAHAVEAALRACADPAARELAGGSMVRCAGPLPAWQPQLDAVARSTVADAARQGYVRTMLFNLAVLLISGLIIGAGTRRARRPAEPSPPDASPVARADPSPRAGSPRSA
jgi:MFS family permease